MVKRVGGMVAEGREESRRSSASVSARSGQGSHTNKKDSINTSAAGLGSHMLVGSAQAVAVRRKETTEGNTGVMALFERSCAVMGIDLLTSRIDEADLNRFGWPELQVEMMKEGIAVAEALPDHSSIVRLCTSALRSLHTYLNAQSQAHLAKMFPQALATLRRRGSESAVAWWLPGRVVLSIEIARWAKAATCCG